MKSYLLNATDLFFLCSLNLWHSHTTPLSTNCTKFIQEMCSKNSRRLKRQALDSLCVLIRRRMGTTVSSTGPWILISHGCSMNSVWKQRSMLMSQKTQCSAASAWPGNTQVCCIINKNLNYKKITDSCCIVFKLLDTELLNIKLYGVSIVKILMHSKLLTHVAWCLNYWTLNYWTIYLCTINYWLFR